MTTDVLQDQIAYYRARAGEYDEWFYRKGRYDRGAEINQQWFDEVALVMREVEALGRVGHVLELAAGTGIWTVELAKIASHITAVDASAEVIAINREKLSSPIVNYIQADLFAWEPDKQYDLVFFAFWLSHVPPEQLDGFLDKVRRATKPGGRIFAIDSLPDNTSSAANHEAYRPDDIYHTRKLNDGREFKIVKIFYDPADLARKLAEHGFNAQVKTSGRYFWYTSVFRTP
ncbi:MAG: class I SAM-dependent methyltransferase [Anaerolineae bacterium]|nr:class I SAM-dependent methyltransferase [Anaerolineae bacterium]